MTNRLLRNVAAVLVPFVLVAAACGDDGGDGAGSLAGSSGTAAAASTTVAPRAGGELKFAAFSEIAGLDPLVALGHGTSGGIQMAAVYDTLMRYDTVKREYVNHMTASVTPNADSTEWTIKVKPGIKFTDGTDFDAEAVKFGLNRHRSGMVGAPPCAELIGCPVNSRSSNAYMQLISDIVTTDKLTLTVKLKESWASFQYALANDAGNIPSPTALKKCDGSKQPKDCSFNLSPVGAGPFMVESFTPNESIKMVRNPNYFAGPVYLDRLTFVSYGDGGGDKSYDALSTGTVQAAYLRSPQAVAKARDAKLPGLLTTEFTADLMFMNMGVKVNCANGKPEPLCVGKPNGPTATQPVTANLKIRQAVAAAWNPQVVNDRAYGGKGKVSTTLFGEAFAWDPGVPGPKYEPETAKRLVDEAKAGGWNGRLDLVMTAAQNDEGIAIATMMKAVGIEVNLIPLPATEQQARLFTEKNFDLGSGGTSIGNDDSAMWSLSQNLDSKSTSNRVGFSSPKVDQALKDLRLAKTDAERKAAYKVIAEEVNAQLPLIPKAARETYVSHNPKVSGLTMGMRAYIYFDKAWIAA